MVATHGMEKMIATFTVGIAITADSNDGEFMVYHFGSHSDGYRPAVQGVEDIAPCVVRQFTRLPDAGYQQNPARFEIKVDQSFFHSLQNAKVAAARAPGRGKPGIVIYGYHAVTSRFFTIPAIKAGVKGRPSYFRIRPMTLKPVSALIR